MRLENYCGATNTALGVFYKNTYFEIKRGTLLLIKR